MEKASMLAVDRDDTAVQAQLFEMIQQKTDALFFFLDAEDVIMTVLPSFSSEKTSSKSALLSR